MIAPKARPDRGGFAMNIAERLAAAGEHFASGLMEQPEASPFLRYARAMRRYLENFPLMSYHGEPLYPCGSVVREAAVNYDYSYTVSTRYDDLKKRVPEAVEPIKELISKYSSQVPRRHCVGGDMYIHSYPNFSRIIKEGLADYERRVNAIRNNDIRLGLQDVLCGIRYLHGRILAILEAEAPDSDLCRAFRRIPFAPAENLYEALVCMNFVYYLDGCDNIGRPDADLIHLWRGEDMTEVLRCFFKNVNANYGWSGAIGPEYNALTAQCLRAVKGLRRPSLELRVRPDMPAEIWQLAEEAIYAGGGSPSLYNEDLYQKALRENFPRIPEADLAAFAGGGCTETMLVGMSNVGSLDAGINLALIFAEYMQENLAKAESFEEFYNGFIRAGTAEIREVLETISQSQELRAKYRPNPMRTLFVDDCIAKEKDFNAGGTRYSWSVVNIAGLINVLDSLLVIRHLVFDKKFMDGGEFLAELQAGENFRRFADIPRHGKDDPKANAMAHRLSADVCAAFEGKTPWLGGKFLPSSIQFTTYHDAGRAVGATPDGRSAGAPLCDSVGAIFGNDTEGATALLCSAAALCQEKMLGTPVLNLKLDATRIGKNLPALVKGYFRAGGMQMQITCVNREELLAAKENPEKYPNLIVRIGGYSEYFRRLSPELQQTVIDRTLYGV